MHVQRERAPGGACDGVAGELGRRQRNGRVVLPRAGAVETRLHRHRSNVGPWLDNASLLRSKLPGQPRRVERTRRQTRVPTGATRGVGGEAFASAPTEEAQMSVTTERQADATAIRPFRVDVADDALEDLRDRIGATRWPSKELVDDRSQGAQLATIKALAQFWATNHDWRACESRLNALPQFVTEIDGVDIHFIHAKSQHDNA